MSIAERWRRWRRVRALKARRARDEIRFTPGVPFFLVELLWQIRRDKRAHLRRLWHQPIAKAAADREAARRSAMRGGIDIPGLP